jgi:hypothetical protein
MFDKLIVWVWANWRQIIIWLLWGAATGFLGFYLISMLVSDDKRWFLPGKTSQGHHQIEIKCDVCHTTFGGVKQEACLRCHETELEQVNDNHGTKKFSDPRNAPLLEKLNAQSCITCHTEHQQEITDPIGVTVAMDVCVYCHLDIAKDRPTHQGMGFDTCHNCHNYHDNRSLYEDFLVKHLHEPDTLPNAKMSARNFREFYKPAENQSIMPLTWEQRDNPVTVDLTKAHDWEHSSHANAGVNCKACHSHKDVWQNKPEYSFCEDCHRNEVKGFLAGKHGLRLAQNLSAMTTDQSQLPMAPMKTPLELNCNACHPAHQFDTTSSLSAVDACLKCHNDTHSRAYKASSHFRLWNESLKGQIDKNAGVSCATCHLPRETKKRKGVLQVTVQHNQNHNLRPNQKMVREVCIQCHGLGFTLDSLADRELILNNFAEHPKKHLISLEMTEKPTNKTQENNTP